MGNWQEFDVQVRTLVCSWEFSRSQYRRCSIPRLSQGFHSYIGSVLFKIREPCGCLNDIQLLSFSSGVPLLTARSKAAVNKVHCYIYGHAANTDISTVLESSKNWVDDIDVYLTYVFDTFVHCQAVSLPKNSARSFLQL